MLTSLREYYSMENTTVTSTSNLESSPVERYLLIAWSILALALILPGNILVLVSSLKYRALKLDKITVVLIENIAVADLLSAVGYVLPNLGAIISEKWIFGNVFCFVHKKISNVSIAVANFMIVALSISKLTVLLFPLRARTRASKTGYIIATSIWGLVVAENILMEAHLFDWDQIEIGDSYLLVWFECRRYPNHWLVLVAYCLATIVPVLLVFMTTTWLLMYVKKVRGLQRQSVITLVCVSMVFCVSYVPSGVFYIVRGMNLKLESLIYFYRFMKFVIYLNIAANPIIYYFTVKSFNSFVKDLAKKMLPVNRVVPQVQLNSIQ